MPSLACPRCGRMSEYQTLADLPSFPFCSRRCKLIDLGGWLDEEHRISTPLPPPKDPGQPQTEDEEEE